METTDRFLAQPTEPAEIPTGLQCQGQVVATELFTGKVPILPEGTPALAVHPPAAEEATQLPAAVLQAAGLLEATLQAAAVQAEAIHPAAATHLAAVLPEVAAATPAEADVQADLPAEGNLIGNI